MRPIMKSEMGAEMRVHGSESITDLDRTILDTATSKTSPPAPG